MLQLPARWLRRGISSICGWKAGDWLDKPHFPFWVAAPSFRVFGVNGFAYKFPGLLFWAAGGFYTLRLATILYGKPVARIT
jgi:4-amino-4-deoxy-L-arabinose transferase-like glycosyltransferase